MEQNKKREFIRGCCKGIAVAGAVVGIMISAGEAQVSQANAPLTMKNNFLGYSAGLSTRATYSDNINLQSGALKNDEFIISTSLTGGVIVSTRRVTAIVRGNLDLSYLADQSDFVVNQRIGGTSTFTVADDWLYFDLSGSTSRQLAGDNARFSSNVNAARGQRANVHSYVASPYVYHQLSNQSVVEMRYRFSQSFIGDTNTGTNLFAGLTRNDSKTHEVLASYQSGGLLDTVRFRVSAYGSDTTEDATAPFPDFGYRQGSITGDAQFALSTQFSLSGSVGYDEVETQGASSVFFNNAALSGVTWRAGFTAQPGPRSNVRFEYGERFGDDFIDADISYEMTNRLVLTARASRSFRTRTQSVSSAFRTNQLQTLAFADRLNQGGGALSPGAIVDSANYVAGSVNGLTAQTNGVAVSDSVRASIRGDFGRSIVSVDGFYNDDNFGFRQVETIGGSMRLSRQMSRKMTGTGSLTLRNADTSLDTTTCVSNPLFFGFDPTDPLFNAVVDCAALAASNGATTTLLGRIGVSRTVYKNVSAFLNVTHAERFSENAQLEYGENTVMIGLTLDIQ